MATRIWNFEFRAKVALNLVNNQSIADANTTPTEGHTTVAEPHTMAAEPYTMAAEPHTMAAEPHTMAAEPHTMAPERCNFSSSSLPEGHTMATRRRIESRMRSNSITMASRW